MEVSLDDNAGRVVRERALRKICGLLMDSNTVSGKSVITQYGTT
jgi:hypothetical protein